MESYLGERSLEQSPDEVNEQQTQRRHRLRWDSVPQLPNTLAHSAIVHFVSFVEGTISKVDIDVLNQMEELESVVDMEVYPQFMKVGNPIQKTVDIRKYFFGSFYGSLPTCSFCVEFAFVANIAI